MIHAADVKIAVLRAALGIKSLEDKELFEKLEQFWYSAYQRGRQDEAGDDPMAGCPYGRSGYPCGNCTCSARAKEIQND
jgi:hypothetical protein